MEVCKIQGRPAPQDTARAKRVPSAFVPSRDPRKPLQISLRYIGGPEGCWMVEARGAKWHVCGSQTVLEAFRGLNAGFTKKV